MYYELTVTQFSKMLENLAAWLDQAAAHADAKKFDPEVLLGSRLAPDQFNLMRQIQIACDNAKAGAARLAGKDAPAHADEEKTLADAKARIAKTVAYLKTFSPSDFSGAAERKISMPRWSGKHLTGHDYALQYLTPNFFFHVTTAYAILRHNGVELGKKHYLGTLPFKE